ncbi:MAG: hypothetical protein H7Z19_13320 [Chitinophagaceae bacterium]|nr:hypothetical protein [Rubrivivax sp.]
MHKSPSGPVVRKLAVAGVVGLCSAVCASATLALPIVNAVSATTTMGEQLPMVNAINQRGLVSPYVSGLTDFQTYIDSNPLHLSNVALDWISTTTSGVADFDLGATLTIDRAAVWNFGGFNLSVAITSVTLLASVDATFLNPEFLGTYGLTVMSNPNSAQVLQFDPTYARFIRLERFVSNGGTYIALGEIAFGTAIPEPGSAQLLGLGLLLAGLLIKLPARGHALPLPSDDHR